VKDALTKSNESENHTRKEIKPAESTINDHGQINVLRDGRWETTVRLDSVRGELEIMEACKRPGRVSELQTHLLMHKRSFRKKRNQVENRIC
jgi:hypothetical protein